MEALLLLHPAKVEAVVKYLARTVGVKLGIGILEISPDPVVLSHILSFAKDEKFHIQSKEVACAETNTLEHETETKDQGCCILHKLNEKILGSPSLHEET
eukprot:15329033-Ditylum_brightwellii.AAC.1